MVATPDTLCNDDYVKSEWQRVFASKGWQIVPVEVREIVNDKNVSDE